MIQIIEAISTERPEHPISIFMAGGITGCPDWQSEFIEKLSDLNVTLFNPRRKNFPIDDPKASYHQIEWEFCKLREAQLVSFWFCKETLCPIVLFELGATIERTGNYIVGVHPEYPRRQDVEIQVSLRQGPFARPCEYSLVALTEQIRHAVKMSERKTFTGSLI